MWQEQRNINYVGVERKKIICSFQGTGGCVLVETCNGKESEFACNCSGARKIVVPATTPNFCTLLYFHSLRCALLYLFICLQTVLFVPILFLYI